MTAGGTMNPHGQMKTTALNFIYSADTPSRGAGRGGGRQEKRRRASAAAPGL